MPNTLRDILADLYAVEPALQQREAELVPILQKLLAAKPDAQVDQAFREKLRAQLLQKTSRPSPFTMFPMRKLSYALFAVFVLAIAGVGTYSIVRKEKTSPTQTFVTSGLSVTNREDAAFGMLGTISTAPKQSGGDANLSTEDAATRSSLIAPVPSQSVRYEYTGEAITLPSLPVLKRVKGFSGTDVQGILTNLKTPLANMQSFTNLGVQQVTFAEDRENGYTITVDALNGMLSIFQNWERWATLSKTVPETATARDLAALPTDTELTTIASTFLRAHGIVVTEYGAPVVRKDWLAADGRMATYTPTDVTVVFPLVVNGKTVVDSGGQAYGIMVSINLATKLVSNVSNITGLQFEASNYPMVEKTETILEIVQRGGVYGGTAATDPKALTVEVGTPTVGYVFSSYQLDGGASDVLVPALIFPLINIPKDAPVYNQNIVVPLVLELLQQSTIQPQSTSASSGAASDVSIDTPEVKANE